MIAPLQRPRQDALAIPKRKPPHKAEPMIGAVDLMHPTAAPVLPTGDDWVYEFKYDGFRARRSKRP